jgi:hypothetical protein
MRQMEMKIQNVEHVRLFLSDHSQAGRGNIIHPGQRRLAKDAEHVQRQPQTIHLNINSLQAFSYRTL